MRHHVTIKYMAHIKNLTLKNYKGFTDFRYSPRSINLIIGKNNTGKTTLLSAIDSLSSKDLSPDSYESPEYEINLNSKKAEIISDNRITEIYKDVTLLDPEMKNEIMIKLYQRIRKIFTKYVKKSDRDKTADEFLKLVFNYFYFLVIVTDKTYFTMFPYQKNYKKTRREIIQDFSKLIPTKVQSRDYYDLIFELSDITIKRQTINKNFKKLKIFSINHFNRLDLSFREGIEDIIEIENFIKENDIIKNFERLTEEGIIFKTKNGLKYLPYDYYGDGFKSLIKTLHFLIKSKNGILLIDEAENHMHPGYMNLLANIIFEYSKKLKIQVFMTTHSYDFIKEILDQCKENKEREKNVLITRLVLEEGEIQKYDYDVIKALKITEELNMDLRGV